MAACITSVFYDKVASSEIVVRDAQTKAVLATRALSPIYERILLRQYEGPRPNCLTSPAKFTQADVDQEIELRNSQNFRSFVRERVSLKNVDGRELLLEEVKVPLVHL